MFYARIDTRKSEYTVFGNTEKECKKLLKDYMTKNFYDGIWEENGYEDEFYAVEVLPGQVWWDMDRVVNKPHKASF